VSYSYCTVNVWAALLNRQLKKVCLPDRKILHSFRDFTRKFYHELFEDTSWIAEAPVSGIEDYIAAIEDPVKRAKYRNSFVTFKS